MIWAILDLFLALFLGLSLSRAGVYVVLEVELVDSMLRKCLNLGNAFMALFIFKDL